MEAVFFGDSHTWPLVQGVRKATTELAIKAQPLGSQRFLCEPFFKVEGPRIIFTQPDVVKHVANLPLNGHEDAIYIASVGMHTAHFTWVTKNFAHLDTVKEEKWAISTAAWDAIIYAKQRYQIALLAELKKRVAGVIIVETPRIFEDSKYTDSSNKDTLLWVDNRVRTNFIKAMDEINVPVARLLPHMIDSSGFMNPKYRSDVEGDQHHANIRLGAELASTIVEMTREIRVAKTSSA